MTTFTFSGASGHAAAPARASVLDFFGAWRQRQHLARLDAHMLRDLGLTEADVIRETGRQDLHNANLWQL